MSPLLTAPLLNLLRHSNIWAARIRCHDRIRASCGPLLCHSKLISSKRRQTGLLLVPCVTKKPQKCQFSYWLLMNKGQGRTAGMIRPKFGWAGMVHLALGQNITHKSTRKKRRNIAATFQTRLTALLQCFTRAIVRWKYVFQNVSCKIWSPGA